MRQHTNGAGHAEEHGVEALLGEAVVLQQDTGVGVDIRVGVLSLAVLGKNTGCDLVDLRNQLEHLVVREVLEGELALGDIARVSLAEHSVAVAGNDAAGLEGVPEVLGDVLVRKVAADGLLHLLQPVENLLVSKTVKGAGETVQASGEREHGGGEGGADEVGGVCGHVAALVVGVDGEVEAHEFNEVLVTGEAELVSKVVRVVLRLVDGRHLAVLEDVAVDARGDGGQLGDQVHAVLEGVLPVLGLLHALGIGLAEGRLVLESSDGKGELSHRVEVAGAAVDELGDEAGNVAAGGPLGGEVADLLLRGDLAGKQKPEETLGKGLLATGGLGEEFLALGDGLAAEADTLLAVEDRTFPNERLDAARTAVNLVESHLTHNRVTVLFAQFLDLLNLLGKAIGEGVLEGLRGE